MANIGFSFNPETTDPGMSRDIIPAGDQPAMIIESKTESTKTGGQLLALTFEIIDGPFRKRRVWSRINTQNASEEATRIGRQELSRLCRAMGQMTEFNDTAVLHNRPVMITIKIRPADGKYPEKNEISNFKPLSGGPSGAVNVAAGSTPAANNPAATAPAAAPAAKQPVPWAKKEAA